MDIILNKDTRIVNNVGCKNRINEKVKVGKSKRMGMDIIPIISKGCIVTKGNFVGGNIMSCLSGVLMIN